MDKDQDRATRGCSHTHSCNPPGPEEASHSHTCFHAHTHLIITVINTYLTFSFLYDMVLMIYEWIVIDHMNIDVATGSARE